MKKELLLAKSYISKKKGVSIGISLLMFIASLLITVSMLIFLDAYPNTEKYAQKLNAGDANISISYSLDGIDDNFIDSLVDDDVEEYDKFHCLSYTAISLPFNGGKLSTFLTIGNSAAFAKTMDKTEVVFEDESITSNYIYIPYQFYSGANYKTGDIYEFEVAGALRSYTIKGFTNNFYAGNNNCGKYEFVVDDASYEVLKHDSSSESDTMVVTFKVKDNTSVTKFILKSVNKIAAKNNDTVCNFATIDSTISNRGFMALIIAVSFLTITLILFLVIVLMLTNTISNYIKESIKEIGAIKAIGYTSKNIRASILIQFIFLALIGTILGILIGYLVMPVMSQMITAQQGLPYSVSFNALSTFLPLIVVPTLVFIIALLATKKIKKIEPIVAIREGLETHNFKKNHFPMSESKLNVNLNLSLKTLFNNIKQNIITFVVVGFLMFVSVIALLMFENFNRNPKVGVMTFETCSGILAFDADKKDEAYEYLKSRPEITNIKSLINIGIIYGDNDDELLSYIIDDIDKLNNKNVCYKGKLPKYDNEICVSGRFAKDYGLSIGDEIKFSFGDKSYNYLITGLVQTCNNGGREALLSKEAATHILDIEHFPDYYWFDCDKETTNNIMDDASAKFGEHCISKINIDEIMEGNIGTFKVVTTLMMTVVLTISCVIILLVLYLLIKSLLHNKRKEYGILKSLGYTNKNLILQTALSFMPSIIISIIVFSFVSYFLANSYMNLIMINFGVMKCSFDIPVLGVVLIAVFMLAISFGFALVEARKIKNIEPYKLLIAE